MEIDYQKDKIKLKKELSSLDKFVIDFTSILNKLKIGYVVVSGYVSILFGRNRSSEDIDLIVQKVNFEKFKALWDSLEGNFECLNTDDCKKAYDFYLNTNHSIRFSRIGEYIPNIEFKFPKTELDFWVINNATEVVFNKDNIFISKIELQIPFKLFLGSEKDIEDAKYLYSLLKDKLDRGLFNSFNRKLKIEDLFNKYIE